jgi:RHS repeat-associated protein
MHYRYDANGIRQSQTVNGVTTRFVVDPTAQYAQVLEERSPAGNVLYLLGDDRIARTQGGTTHYLHSDGLGSTRVLSTATGQAADRWWYEAFGEVESSTGNSGNAFLFAGEQLDPNLGHYYLRARYMDPGNGRFTQMDAFSGYDTDPVSLHKYAYANASPVSYRDPSGYATLLDQSAAQQIMGNLLSRSIAIFNYVGRVQTTIGTIQALGDALRILQDPTSIAEVANYLDPANPEYEGILSKEAFAHAGHVLSNNASRIVKSIVRYRIKTFMRYVPDKKSTVIFYMPTPIRGVGNAKLVNTGVPIPLANFGTRPAVLALGGKNTRFFGIGFGLGTNDKSQRQLFRMDWAKMHGSNHYPGDKDYVDYWTDSGFEFHIPREP